MHVCSKPAYRLARFVLAITLLAVCSKLSAETSDLWGELGEKWSPSSRLPDFSFAGYHCGEKAIPLALKAKDLKRDFGAKGNGVADDTAALKRAIAGTRGVLFIPPGKYRITDVIDIKKSNLVLRVPARQTPHSFFPRPWKRFRGRRTTGKNGLCSGSTTVADRASESRR